MNIKDERKLEAALRARREDARNAAALQPFFDEIETISLSRVQKRNFIHIQSFRDGQSVEAYPAFDQLGEYCGRGGMGRKLIFTCLKPGGRSFIANIKLEQGLAGDKFLVFKVGGNLGQILPRGDGKGDRLFLGAAGGCYELPHLKDKQRQDHTGHKKTAGQGYPDNSKFGVGHNILSQGITASGLRLWLIKKRGYPGDSWDTLLEMGP